MSKFVGKTGLIILIIAVLTGGSFVSGWYASSVMAPPPTTIDTTGTAHVGGLVSSGDVNSSRVYAGGVQLTPGFANGTSIDVLNLYADLTNTSDLYVNNDVFFQGTNRTDVLAYPEQGYSYLVWNDTATNKIYAKNGQTGVVTTNTNAAMLINTCLNALTAGRTWKEKIVVKGNITLSAALNLPSYTIFDVQGYLFIKTDIIALNIVGTVGTHKIFVDVLNAHIYCKVASTAPAIKFDYADQCYINTVWVRGFYYGLKSTNSIINDVYGSTLQYNTIAIDLGSASNAWTFNGCDLSANTGAYSVYIHGLSKGNRFFGCTLEDNGGVGAQLEDQSNNLFKGCYFEGNDNYDVVISETAATQGANSFEDCSFDSSKITGKTGLVAFATSYKDKLINCHFLNGAGYTYTLAAILLDPGAIDSQVIGCNHNAGTGTLAFIRNLGTGTIINQNPTYVTANSGTFSIALHATTATITHGLSYTPAATDITITWTTVGGLLNCTSWSVTGIGAATFTVNLYDANGAAKGPSGTVTGSWAARKTP